MPLHRRTLLKLAAPAIIGVTRPKLLYAAKHGTPIPDGFPGTPNGTTQLPTILNGYVKRPGWRCAGVDYPVGIDPTVTPVDPFTLFNSGGPNGNLSFDAPSKRWIVGAFAGTTALSGLDFTVNGHLDTIPWQLDINNSGTTTVTNCKLGPGQFTSAINSSSALSGGMVRIENGAGPVTITQCLFDTIGINGIALATLPVLLNHTSNSSLTVTYCWIRNGQTAPFSVGPVVGSGATPVITFQYNLYENYCGQQPPLHSNSLQGNTGCTFSPQVTFNTVFQEAQPTPAGQTFQFYSQSPTALIVNPTHAYNVLIALNTRRSAVARANTHSYNMGDVITVGGAPSKYYFCTTAGTSAGSVPGAYTSGISFNAGSPGSVTWTGHGHSAGDIVYFYTTGSPATETGTGQGIGGAGPGGGGGGGGATLGMYFVLAAGLGTNSFEISGTSGGTAINIAGTGSGTMTGCPVVDGGAQFLGTDPTVTGGSCISFFFEGSFPGGGHGGYPPVGIASFHDNYYDFSGSTSGDSTSIILNTTNNSVAGYRFHNNFDMNTGSAVTYFGQS